jgi:hypothetical protein
MYLAQYARPETQGLAGDIMQQACLHVPDPQPKQIALVVRFVTTRSRSTLHTRVELELGQGLPKRFGTVKTLAGRLHHVGRQGSVPERIEMENPESGLSVMNIPQSWL